MTRDETIASLLENMNLTKRSMAGHIQHIMSNLSVSPVQLELLYVISSLQPVGSKELASNRHLSPGAISQLCDSLVQHGLVARETNTADRRTHMLRTTKTGEKMLHTVQKRREALFQRVMQNLSDKELEIWLHVQEKLIRELESESNRNNK